MKNERTIITRQVTGGPPIVLFFGGKETPYYGKSVLFGDYFSTKTSEMGEIVFQSPLFGVFPFSKVYFFGNSDEAVTTLSQLLGSGAALTTLTKLWTQLKYSIKK